jgi:hypothetical protein
MRHSGFNDKYCYLVLCSLIGTSSYTHVALKYAVFVRKVSITACLLCGTERRLKKEFSIEHIIQNGTTGWHTVNINTSKCNIYQTKYVTISRTNFTYALQLMWLTLHNTTFTALSLCTELGQHQSTNMGSTCRH